jgi:hypothetical protein
VVGDIALAVLQMETHLALITATEEANATTEKSIVAVSSTGSSFDFTKQCQQVKRSQQFDFIL